MKRGSKNMYSVIVQDIRKNSKKRNDFYVGTSFSDTDLTKLVISQKIVNKISDDVGNMSHVLVESIMEDIYYGDKRKKRHK